MHVGLQTVSCIESRVGVIHHFLQVSLVHGCHLIWVGIILTICLIEIDFSQEGSTCSLGGAAFFSLCGRKNCISILKVVDDLLPTLIIGVFCIREIVVVLFGHIRFVHEWDFLEQTLQLEMSVGTQELHLSSTLLNGGIPLVSTSQNIERETDTWEIIIETSPDRAEWPVGSHHTWALFQTVERLTIRKVWATYIGVVRTGIVVP